MKKLKDFLDGQIRHKFQRKVLLAILLPVVVICIITNVVISTLLGQELLEKKEDIEEEYLSVIYSYLDEMKDNLDVLAIIAESSSNVKWVMSKSDLNTTETKKYALNTQNSLTASLNGSAVSEYVESMVLVNQSGMFLSITQSPQMMRAEDIFASPLFDMKAENQKSRAGLTESAIDKGEVRMAYLYPLNLSRTSFIYIELSTDMISDLLKPYEDSASISIDTLWGEKMSWYSSEACESRYAGDVSGRGYHVNSREFEPFHLSLNVMSEDNIYTGDNSYIMYILLVTVILVICVAITVSRLLSTRVTQPLRRLSGHIRRLSDKNQITVDKSIEEGDDEIAGIGKAFNRLVRHINDLIRTQKEIYEQKQKVEISALQAQINPHFLYNTLDSVRWMAVIQKANNIADTVMSLENLLRNMAKGSGNKITLKEELALARDYVNLQQVRYMEIFDYICEVPEEFAVYRIVKMTMQPIIENAILHGIEPTGTYGEIRVHAWDTEEDLYISVEDNGAGINGEEFARLVTTRKDKNAMSGIGVANVDERLKMTYGSAYGLIYEGEEGRFTRVTIHIPKEK